MKGQGIMDYQSLADSFGQIAAVLSLDLRDTKISENYKVAAANDIYKHSVVKDINDFVSNVPYTKYIRVDHNFEGMVEECVTKNHPVHAYVDAAFFNSWMDIYMFPLKSDVENIRYCLFSYSMTPKADVDKMMDISADTALHVLKTCIRLRGDNNFHEAMDSVIMDIREICDASRCTILLVNYEKRKCRVLCEDFVDHVNEIALQDYMGDDFFNIVETWPRLIDGSNCFIIQDEADMKRVDEIAPEWAASLRGAGVETLVIYPLRSETNTLGYIWANNFDKSHTMKIKEILEISTFILSAEIANHQMIKQMKILSSTDLLTGVYNRNAMNNRIMDHDKGLVIINEPYGVFFVDVNGLKTVNDTNGHQAGDNLLKDVADTLKEHFGKQAEIYRVGGDEFMVICEGVTREEFEAFEAGLRANCERPGRAHFAVGSCFSDNTHDIKKSMQIADTRMYEDKEAYYSRHPEYEWSRRFTGNR